MILLWGETEQNPEAGWSGFASKLHGHFFD
jgi:hypothetical protein